MMHHSRLHLGSLLIPVLLILSVLAFSHCSSKTSSRVPLEKLSSNGQWSEAGSVLVSPPIIARIEDTVLATIQIRKPGLFTNERMVIQVKFHRFRRSIGSSNFSLIIGLANGELNGNRFQVQKVTSSSLRLELNEAGKLVFGGIFRFGPFRVMISPMEVEEALSSYSARLRFGDFGVDRVQKDFDLEEIVWGATQTLAGTTSIPTYRIQQAKILTWKVIEDYRPLKVQECVLWIRLDIPSQWILVHVGRNRYFEKGWSGWARYYASHTKPFWIESYDHPPTRDEIELFLNTNNWWTEVKGFKFLDGNVCTNAWQKVTGQPPVKTFK